MGHYKIDPDLCGRCGLSDAEHRQPPETDSWWCPDEDPTKNLNLPTKKDTNAKA